MSVMTGEALAQNIAMNEEIRAVLIEADITARYLGPEHYRNFINEKCQAIYERYGQPSGHNARPRSTSGQPFAGQPASDSDLRPR